MHKKYPQNAAQGTDKYRHEGTVCTVCTVSVVRITVPYHPTNPKNYGIRSEGPSASGTVPRAYHKDYFIPGGARITIDDATTADGARCRPSAADAGQVLRLLQETSSHQLGSRRPQRRFKYSEADLSKRIMNQLRASGHGGAAAGTTAAPRQMNILSMPRRVLTLAACATSATAVNFKLGSSRQISEGHRRRMSTVSRCLSGDKSRVTKKNPGAADVSVAALMPPICIDAMGSPQIDQKLLLGALLVTHIPFPGFLIPADADSAFCAFPVCACLKAEAGDAGDTREGDGRSHQHKRNPW